MTQLSPTFYLLLLAGVVIHLTSVSAAIFDTATVARALSTIDLMPLNGFQQTSSGTTYYVDVQHNSASDSNPGTESQPFRTLQRGVNALSAGDTLFVKDGNYNPTIDIFKNVQIEKTGTSSNWILISAYPGDRPKVYVDTMNGIQIWNSAYIELRGFEVYGMNDPAFVNPDDRRQNGNGISVFGNIGNRFVRVIDNHVHHVGGNGIGVANSDQILLRANRIWHCTHRSRAGNSGISITHPKDFVNNIPAGTYGTVVDGNTMFDNENKFPFIHAGIITDGNGIIFDFYAGNGNRGTYSKRMLAVNNVAHHNGGRCLHAFNFHDVDFVYNSCYANLRTASLAPAHGELSFAIAQGIHVYNNVVHATNAQFMLTFFANTNGAIANNNLLFGGPSGVFNNGVNVQNTISSNPRFVNPTSNFFNTDLHLQTGSAAINAANANLVQGIDRDFDGNARPVGGAPDVGAFEFGAGNVPASPSASPSKSPQPTPSNSVAPSTSPGPSSLPSNSASPSPAASQSSSPVVAASAAASSVPSPSSSPTASDVVEPTQAPTNGGDDIDSYMPANKVVQSGSGKTYIVDLMHPAANDWGNPGTEDKPFRSMRKGVNVLKAGDTLLVKNGEYNEWGSSTHNLHIQLTGSSTDYIVIKAYPGHKPVFKSTTTNGLQIFSSSYLEFSGFEVSGVGGWGNPGNCISAMGFPGNRYVRIIENYVHDCRGGGIVLAFGNHVLIARNKITKSTNALPYAGGAVTIAGSVATDSAGYGIVVANNEVFDNGLNGNGNGIFFNWFGNSASPVKALVVNNIVHGNTGRCIHAIQSYNVVDIDNNCFNNVLSR